MRRFRSQLKSDPASAEAGYDLSQEELALLAAGLEEGAGQGSVEQRTSKAGLAGLLAMGGRAGRR